MKLSLRLLHSKSSINRSFTIKNVLSSIIRSTLVGKYNASLNNRSLMKKKEDIIGQDKNGRSKWNNQISDDAYGGIDVIGG